jgi:hypothetical protein
MDEPDTDLIYTKNDQFNIKPIIDEKIEELVISDHSLIKKDKSLSKKASELYINYKKQWLDDFDELDNYNYNEINRHSFILKLIQRNLKITSNDNHEQILEKTDKVLDNIITLKSYLNEGGNLVSEDYDFEDRSEIKFNINRIYECLEYSKKLLKSFTFVEKIQDEFYDNGANDDTDIDKIHIIDFYHSELKNSNEEVSKLYFYFLRELYCNNYRRKRNTNEKCDDADIYKPRLIKDEKTNKYYNTHSYERLYKVSDFLYKKCSREENNNIFMIINNKYGGNPNQIRDFLSNTQDSYFLDIIKNRNVFSFKNGVYINKMYDEEKDLYYDIFYSYTNQQYDIKKYLGNKVSCNYINENFEYIYEEDWYNIKTPNFQKILDTQWIDEEEYEEICRITYMLIGRLLYNLGDLENWQIMPFLKGLAGTGKGTLIKLIQLIYDYNDVGVMSSNIEKQFGLAPLINKLAIVAPEVDENFGLNQAQAQSMISGESVSYAIKNKSSQTIYEWNVPLIFAANVFPNWNDNSGSLQRRMIILNFCKIVSEDEKDPELVNKLKKELPLILQKISKAYLYYVNHYKNQDIWKVMPKFIHRGKLDIAKNTNNLYSFIDESNIIYNKNYYITFELFNRYYMEYCIANKQKNKTLSEDVYLKAFDLIGKINKTKIKVYDTTTNSYQCMAEFVNGDKIENYELSKKFITGLTFKDYLDEYDSIKIITDIKRK